MQACSAHRAQLFSLDQHFEPCLRNADCTRTEHQAQRWTRCFRHESTSVLSTIRLQPQRLIWSAMASAAVTSRFDLSGIRHLSHLAHRQHRHNHGPRSGQPFPRGTWTNYFCFVQVRGASWAHGEKQKKQETTLHRMDALSRMSRSRRTDRQPSLSRVHLDAAAGPEDRSERKEASVAAAYAKRQNG